MTTTTPEHAGTRLTRRGLLAGALALGAGALGAPIFRITPAKARPGCPAPPGFPSSVEVYQQAYRNWSGEIRIDDLWTCAPRTPSDVVTVANWAVTHGYRLRARGHMHNWSPLTVTRDTTCGAPVVLVDTTQHLTDMHIISSSPAAVRVQTGTAMEALLGHLESAGYGFATVPSTGGISVGGVLAIDGHGASLPARGEVRTEGHAYGSLSNLVLSLTAVVWDERKGAYILRTFDRADPDAKAFLTHLGRAFLTEVTLEVGRNQNLRCVSHVDIPGREIFAAPGARTGRTFADFVDQAGRVEALWFPFTDNPWLKVWSVAPKMPLVSRKVTSPYNYPFADNVPEPLPTLAHDILSGNGELTPEFGAATIGVITGGLAATRGTDLWGASKNLLLYVRPTTMLASGCSHVVIARRSDIQRVVSQFASAYLRLLDHYRGRGRYPVNLGIEVRATGLDVPNEGAPAAAEPPVLSALSPRPDHPEWDAAVWLSTYTIPGTPGEADFYRDLERWVFANYTGSYATVRPEWSKGWAFSTTGGWSDPDVLGRVVPDAYRAGRPASANWDWAVRTLDAYDPHRIFTNPFLDRLLR